MSLNRCSIGAVKVTVIEREELAARRLDAGQIADIANVTAGGLLAILGMRRGGLIGAAARIGGTFMLLRGAARLAHLDSVPILGGNTGVTNKAIRVESAVEVECSPDELYRVWRDLENLPAFMSKVLSVRELDSSRSHWVVKGPAGTAVNFDAEIINDVPGRLIAWQTVERSSVVHAGSVHFDPLEDGRTRVRVVMRYDPPAHGLGHVAASLFGDDAQTDTDQFLAKFKQVMETGQAPVSRSGAEVL